MAQIRVENLRKSFGQFTAVQGSNFTIDDGTFFAMLGPSGCGKTTTLRMIAGLELPTDGRILLDGEDVTFSRAAARDIAFVFQFFALYPHMNVAENIGFPLKCQGMARREIPERVAETARLLRIEHLLSRKISGLSGGDRQRVALGGALLRDLVAAQEDLSAGRQFEPGDHAQRRGLAAARGAEQAEELAVLDREGRGFDGGEAAEGLFELFDADLCHRPYSGNFETMMNITVPASMVMKE